ncbi:DUF924 family protein [Massilia sp. W12]|uniref:DUF924 family protein n=1 Tax=Massilia sp. W12 TaxID=3126507 RepID=UPI0030CDD940
MPEHILQFWFVETDQKDWWRARPEFDALLAERFGALLQQAARGELFRWRATPGGRLAEIIVLDQFSRNIGRNSPAAFAQDGMALVLAQEAVAAGALSALDNPAQRAFLLMPYMHSESASIHSEAEQLFRVWAPQNLEFELRHKAIIDRFGRYPHRNQILARASSAAEEAFLLEPGSSF